MASWDLEDSINKHGFSFRKIFIQVITYSCSLYLGLQWSSFTAKVIDTYFPRSTGLQGEFFVNVALTMVIVGFVFMLLKFDRESKNRKWL